MSTPAAGPVGPVVRLLMVSVLVEALTSGASEEHRAELLYNATATEGAVALDLTVEGLVREQARALALAGALRGGRPARPRRPARRRKVAPGGEEARAHAGARRRP